MQMSETTTCPICGAKCQEIKYRHCTLCSSEIKYQPLPQPDLAGIRKVYEKYEHLDALLSDPYWDDDIRGHIRYELWQAVKGICKE